jgi:cytidylate kinase
MRLFTIAIWNRRRLGYRIFLDRGARAFLEQAGEQMFRVLTVAREYGSGGGSVAKWVSQMLGWSLMDKALVQQVAQAANVDPELARRYDECIDSWLHRVSRRALWRGALEGIAAVTEEDFFDAETMALLTRDLIQEAHEKGNCVVVGRGGQCVLQQREDVFHVFIYAPWGERIKRARSRLPAGMDVEEFIRSNDRQRTEYVRLHFGCNWSDPHLYHLMISSELGEETAASIIIDAMERGRKDRA